MKIIIRKEVGEYLIHVWGGEDFTSIKATEKKTVKEKISRFEYI